MALFNNNSDTREASDPTDAYANTKQLFLSFFHIASGLEVDFKAFITSYAENLTSDYQEDRVFGRADPIMTFRSTTRMLNLAWSIPAYSLQEAQMNLAKCNRLVQLMYPAYDKGNRANTLSKPPLMRIRFANLIRNAARGADPSAQVSGLLGAVDSLNVTPSFDDQGGGFFDPGSSTLYPKLITVSCNFKVLHEHDVGWGEEIGFNDPELTDYPFGGTEGQFPVPGSSPSAQVTTPITANSTDGDRLEAAADELNVDGEFEIADVQDEESTFRSGGVTAEDVPDVFERANRAQPGQAV